MATNETKELQETIDELKERIERLEKENANLKGETSWEPGSNETYFAVNGGKISEARNYFQKETDDAVAAGNCFKTKAEAEEFLAWLKARKTLLDDTKGFKPDWDDSDQKKYYIEYDADNDELYVRWRYRLNEGQNIWFEADADVAESVEKHEKEWRIYMGLPEKDSDDE